MPATLKKQEEYEDVLQVVFVETGRADSDQMTSFAIDREWLGGQAMWTKSRPFDTGLNYTPSYALLSPEGELLAKGNPMRDHSQIEDLIEEWEKRLTKGPDDAPKAVSKLVGDFHKGKAVKALAGLEDLIADPGKKDADAVRRAATEWRDKLVARADRDLTRVGWLIENGYYESAEDRIGELAKAYKGHDDWIARLDKLEEQLSAPDLETERKAAEALAKAEAKLFKSGTKKTKPKTFESIIEDYPGTHAARRAERFLPLLQG